MAFSDRELICRDCQGTFVFTAGEQEFYATKGLQHDPVRCPSCRASRRTMRPEEREEAPSYGVFVSWGGRTPRQLHAATCHECGQTTEIPFMPRGDRPGAHVDQRRIAGELLDQGLRERQVMVPANVAWSDTAIDVHAGQNIYFESSGEIRWGPSRRAGPSGEQNSPNNPSRPMPNRPGASLIGRVGDSRDYFFIGEDRGAIRVRNGGRLYLGINDDNLADNTGYFTVIVFY